MSFESRIDREMEQQRRRENEKKTKKLDAAAEYNTPKLSIFDGSPDHPDWSRDENYVTNTESKFQEESGYHAHALEHLFQFAIAQGRLLKDPAARTYETEPIWVTRYDDLRNRIDAAATVHTKTGDITFGIDLTTNPDPSVIRKKLLLGTNDPTAKLPAGFSQLKYYRDRSRRRCKKAFVPRYCIGMDSSAVDDFMDGLNIDDSGNVHIGRETEAVPAFKTLYEMSRQNELFKAELYAKEDAGIITPEEEEALAQMEELDSIYLQDLQRIARLLPAWATNNGTLSIDEIAEKFMNGEDRDQTFAAIIETTEQLYQEREKSGDPSYLQKASERYRRPPQVRPQKMGHQANYVAGRLSYSTT